MSEPFSARYPGKCAACGEHYPSVTSRSRSSRARHAPPAGSDTRKARAIVTDPMTAAEARERINIATDYPEGNIHD